MLILQVVGANASPGINKCLEPDGTLLSTRNWRCTKHPPSDVIHACLLPPSSCQNWIQTCASSPHFSTTATERNERAASATGNTCLGTTSCVLPQCNSKEGTEDGISMQELFPGNKRKQENISKSVLVDGESTEDRQDWSKALGAHSEKAKMTRTRTRRHGVPESRIVNPCVCTWLS